MPSLFLILYDRSRRVLNEVLFLFALVQSEVPTGSFKPIPNYESEISLHAKKKMRPRKFYERKFFYFNACSEI
jgi:hypothetical protein